MTIFVNLVNKDREQSLRQTINSINNGFVKGDVFFTEPEAFKKLPTAAFSYWIEPGILNLFSEFPPLNDGDFTACVGLQTSDNFRFIRLNWEVPNHQLDNVWVHYAKGGEYSQYYSDLHLVVNWHDDGHELKAWAGSLYNESHWSRILKNVEYLFKPGLTWTSRTTSELSVRALPANCAFDTKGCCIFHKSDDQDGLLSLLGITNSSVFKKLVDTQIAAVDAAARSYDVGIFQRTPIPENIKTPLLSKLAVAVWKQKYLEDSCSETSHAFTLPSGLQSRLVIDAEVSDDSTGEFTEINKVASHLYGIEESLIEFSSVEFIPEPIEPEETANFGAIASSYEIISWCVGVTFGRFDIDVALGLRKVGLPESPFEALPKKSPGMLLDDGKSSIDSSGILVDDPGQSNDLPGAIYQILDLLDVTIDVDIRLWLKKNFFALHLKQYSKSRRKAPIYWPLQTKSGGYTLWLYIHSIDENTLYTCVNDYVEPKMESLSDDIGKILKNDNRDAQEEIILSDSIELENELKDFRDELLRIAQFWRPNFNDGVQITAAPLSKLFLHSPWSTALKKTWEELETGKYDWAHTSYSIWPERVLRKCRQDRSLAIAHGVEVDFWEEIEVTAAQSIGPKLVWQQREMPQVELEACIKNKIAQG